MTMVELFDSKVMSPSLIRKQVASRNKILMRLETTFYIQTELLVLSCFFNTSACKQPKNGRHTAILTVSSHQLPTVIQSIMCHLLPQEVVEGTKDHVLDVLSKYIRIDQSIQNIYIYSQYISIFYLVSKHTKIIQNPKKYIKINKISQTQSKNLKTKLGRYMTGII